MNSNRHGRHRPLGPRGTWKTGQRVPRDGTYVDQHGVTSTHFAGDTFPPSVGRKGECAFRRMIPVTRSTAI